MGLSPPHPSDLPFVGVIPPGVGRMVTGCSRFIQQKILLGTLKPHSILPYIHSAILSNTANLFPIKDE